MSTESRDMAHAGASAEAIQHHYDVGNDFYRLWLDERLVYSCALWEEGDDLERAQVRKLDWMLDVTHAEPGAHVLDVGCGWGALMERAVERGAEPVVGLTLSEEQAEYVRGRGEERIGVRVEHWADHEPERPYDAIVSVGAFEHFADLGMKRAEKVEAYREFFSRARRWLKPGGRIAIQCVSKGNARRDRRAMEDARFVYERIFRETDIPWPSELIQASENKFEPEVVVFHPGHYIRTLEEWERRLAANRERALELVGPEILADYERYLPGSRDQFAKSYVTLLRIALRRVV